MMRLNVAPHYVVLALTAGLSLVLSACIYSPSGVNKSDTLYPVPDETGVVTITFTAPAGNQPQEKVRFQLVPPDEEATALEKVSEDTGPDYVATFDTTPLDAGIHYVDIFYDEPPEDGEDTLIAKLAFVKPEPEATDDEEATEGEGEE